MYRNYKENIKDILSRSGAQVLIIEGARQTGKSYLANDFLQGQAKKIEINLEKNPSIKMQIDACHDFSDFEKLLKFNFNFADLDGQFLYIDEAQESEQLGRFVLQMKEDWKFTKSLLTGSSMSKLFKKGERVPVGRVHYLTLRPFSFREFMRMGNHEHELDNMSQAISESNYNRESSAITSLHSQLLKHFDNYLQVGGLPASVIAFYQDGMSEVENVFANLVASQRDDFYRKEQLKSHLFIDALKGVANNIGSPSKYTHVANSHYDAKMVVELLKEWHLILEVEQVGSHSTQSFAPKRYLYDIGIMRFLRETSIPTISVINTVDEKLRIPLGGILENVVLNELLGGRGGYVPISGWKRASKADIEVDFISRHIPYEVKASLNPSERHAKNLIHYLQYNKQVDPKGFLISLAPFFEMKIDNISIVNRPAYLI